MVEYETAQQQNCIVNKLLIGSCTQMNYKMSKVLGVYRMSICI